MKKSNISKVDQSWIQRVIKGKALYDWNKAAIEKQWQVSEPSRENMLQVQLRSEDFRDAMGVANRIPTKREKMSFISDLSSVGVNMITLDIFSSVSASRLNRSNKTSLKLLSWMQQQYPQLKPVILARSTPEDIAYLKKAYDLNPNVIAIIFQDLSEVRRIVEGWGDFDEVLTNLTIHIKEAKAYGIHVMAFTENLSITQPDDVKKYVQNACHAGADWIGIADTAGRLLPVGASYLTNFVTQIITDYTKKNSPPDKIGVVFHGHDDLGNAVSNSIAAIAAGATVIDVVVNGLGERVGNTNLIELAANIEYRLRSTNGSYQIARFDLSQFSQISARYTRMTATQNRYPQPLVSRTVFSTHFGIHANYYYKVELLALQMKEAGYSHEEVTKFKAEAWKVYSAISPLQCGTEPDIRVSPFSGAANVILRLKKLKLIKDLRDLTKLDTRVKRILKQAKHGWGELHDDEIRRIWKEVKR